jgi:transcriptional regulator with XRE-family HTH domain
MPRVTSPVLPATAELLRQFGERLRLARLRRHLSAKQVAERAGMNPMTLRSLERGGLGVTMGAYLAVMQVLGIEKELEHLAQADPLGRSLQDARLIKSDVAGVTHVDASEQKNTKAIANPQPRPRQQNRSRSRSETGGFVSSRDLAALLTPASKAKRR